MAERKHLALDYDGMSEPELVTFAQQGHREAFRVIMQRSNQQLFRVARGIVHEDGEAEDVVQEAYLRAFAHIGSFRHESSFLTWLTRIVINEGRGRLRSQRQQVDLDQVEAAQNMGAQVVAFPGGQPMENPETEVARMQIRHLIEQAIDGLPEAFRLVFVLRDVQECSIEETASLLDIRTETVKTRLHRARRLLRAALDEKLASTVRGTFPFLGERCTAITETVLQRLAPIHGWRISSADGADLGPDV